MTMEFESAKMMSKVFQTIIQRKKRPLDKYFLPFGAYNYRIFRNQSHRTSHTADDTNVNIVQKKREASGVGGNAAIIKKLKAAGYDDLQHIPKHSLSKSKHITYLHLIDKNVGETFASLIAADLAKKNAFILEMNPGFGYLTEKLLEAGVSHLYLYEKIPHFFTYLASIAQKYPNCVNHRPYNFLSLSTVEYTDRVTGKNAMSDILQGVPKREWIHEPSIYIIGSVPEIRFLYYLQHSLTSGYLSDYGRTVLYIALLPSALHVFSETTEEVQCPRANNICLQLLFDCKVLGLLPRRAFLPWPPDKIRRKLNRNRYIKDNELMNVVKLVPKIHFFDDNFTKQDAEIFFYFLSIHLKRHDLRVISELEKWIPNCGPRLIKLNFNIFTRFIELSPPELLNLFKVFKSWPEYETSVFISLVEDMISRKIGY